MHLFQLYAGGGSTDLGLSNLHLPISVWYSCNWNASGWHYSMWFHIALHLAEREVRGNVFVGKSQPFPFLNQRAFKTISHGLSSRMARRTMSMLRSSARRSRRPEYLNKSKTDFLSRNLKSFVKAVWEKSKWQWLSQQNSTLSSFLRSWLDYCTNTGGSDQTYHQKHR